MDVPTVVDEAEKALSERRSWPRGLRWAIVTALGLSLGVGLGLVLWGLVIGSWSMGDGGITVSTDTRAQIGALRDELAASGAAPAAVSWLDLALAPETSGLDVLLYVTAALDAARVANDPALADVEGQLREVMGGLRGGGGGGPSVEVPVVTLAAP